MIFVCTFNNKIENLIILLTKLYYFIFDSFYFMSNIFRIQYIEKFLKENILIHCIKTNPYRFINTCLLILFFTFETWAQIDSQNNDYTVNEENWLQKKIVNCIFKDSEGLIWAGTNSGLYSFDGFRVKQYITNPNQKNTIFNNTITSVKEDAEKNLLICTESGLSYYIRNNDNFITLSSQIEKFEHLVITGKKTTFVSVKSNNLLYELIKQNKEYILKPIFKLPKDIIDNFGNITSLAEANDGNLLVGFSNNLCLLNTKSKTLLPTDFKFPVSQIVKVNNAYWIGTKGNGLFYIAIANDKVTIKKQFHFGIIGESGKDDITSISKIAQNSILVCTHKHFYNVNTRNETIVEPTQNNIKFFNENNILSSLYDNQNFYWIGTRRGLYKITSTALKTERVKINAPNYIPINNEITYIFKDNNQQYFVRSLNDGNFAYYPNNNQFQKLEIPKEISRFYQSKQGEYYCSGEKSFYKSTNFLQKPTLTKLFTSQYAIHFAIEINPQTWWIACNMGDIKSYQTGKNLFLDKLLTEVNKQFTGGSPIYTMMLDKDKNLWIGSRGDGLMKVNIVTGKIEKFSGEKTNGSISRRILSLKEDAKGNIWIGTRDAGVYNYNKKTKSFTQYSKKEGLPSNVVCAIGEDSKGNIYVSTDNGIAKYLPNQLLPFRDYGQNDGIEYSEFTFNSVAQGNNNDIYFGNSNGIYKIKEKEINKNNEDNLHWSFFHTTDNSNQPIDDIENPNKFLDQIKNNNEVILSNSEKNFEIGFSNLNLINPSKNRYAYKLHGFDENWKFIYNNSQMIQYLNVPSGEYIFEVKYADSEGIWSKKTKSFKLIIEPAWWFSKPMLLFYLIILSIAAYYIHKFYKEWKALQTKLEEEVAHGALQDQQMVFFSDLSHEIKNRLTIILGPLEKALTGKKVNQAVLNNLYEQTLRLKRITDQIMNIRKSEAGEFLLKVSEGNIFTTLENLCQDVEPLGVIRNIKVSYHFNENEENIWYDNELIEIILLNILNNSLKYTPPGGSVNIKGEFVILETSDLPEMSPSPGKYLKCSIDDNGIGIPQDDIENIFNRFYRATNTKNERESKSGTGIGLELVARLIKKHKGFIDLKSEVGQYTSVVFYLPVEKKHFLVNELKLSIADVTIVEEKEELDIIETPSKPTQTNNTLPLLLIIDNDEDIVELLTDIFEKDFRIITATNGEDGLIEATNREFDLIICDLAMPKMDGLTFLRNVKTNPSISHIPVIILTGRNSETQKILCLQNNADDFIDKPFSHDLLKWRVKNIIKNRSNLKTKFTKTLNINPVEQETESLDEKFIQSIINLIEKNILNSELSVELLAAESNMSRATFYRKMESLLNESPSVFIRTYKLKKAAQLLKTGNLYISEVAYQTGFNNPKYFTKCFQKEFGISPSEYVKSLKTPKEPF